MALEITKGLFGIEIPGDKLSQDEASALAFAQLSPTASVRASGMMAGSMLGRGAADVGRVALGAYTGADVRTPEEKRRSAEMKVVARLKEGNINPGDPAAYLPIVAQAFNEEGLVEEALKAANALNSLKAQATTLSTAQTKAQADMIGALASASKAGTDAAEEARKAGPEYKAQELAKTGHFTPASIESFKKSGNLNDLTSLNKKVQKVETKDGVYLVPEDTMSDQKTWVRVGDPVRAAGSSADRETAAVKLQALMSKHRASNEEDSDMLARLQSGTPEQRNDAAMMRALAAAAVGTDHAGRVLGEGEKLTEGEQQMFGYAKAAEFGEKIYKTNWASKPLPDVSKFKAALQSVASNDPNSKMSLQLLLTMSPDAETRRYIGDAFGVLLPVLRKDTGAAIAASEWVNYINTYIPQSNDLPEARMDKEKRLNERIVGMRALIAVPKYRVYTKRYDEMMADEQAKVGAPRERSEEDLAALGRTAQKLGPEAVQQFLKSLSPAERAIVDAKFKRK